MNLPLYASILWRFRILTAAGLLFAVAVAFLAYADVRFDGGRPAASVAGEREWRSRATLLVTQPGFPWGTAFDKEGRARFADTNRFKDLALLYAELAESDLVQRELALGPDSSVTASPVHTADFSSVLPMVQITARSASAEHADELALAASQALQKYLADEQEANDVPPSQRVELPLVRQPEAREVVTKASPIRPTFLFLLIAMATVGLAFVLENLRPRVRPELVVAPSAEPESLAVRRSSL